MKKINLFSRLWSSGGNSQSSDVGYDSRLTVGSPSGLESSKVLKFVSVLVLILTIGIGNVWGAKITDYTKIVSGTEYYIGATTSSTDYYWSSPQTTTGTGLSGTAVTSKASATIVILEGSGTSWKIKIKGTSNYVTLNGRKANGKFNIAASSSNWTFSNASSLIKMLYTGFYCLQKNNSGTQFGSYANTQTNVWLETAAAATPTVTPDPTSLDWGTVLQGSSQSTKTISITGTNLTAGTLTISATGGYSVTPTSKSVSGTLSATTLTVTPPSTATTGAKNGKVTISGGGLASAVEVNLSMTVNAASTVTWMNNGSEYTTTLVENGQKPTFPSNPSSCDGTSTTFYGWSTSEWSGKIDDISAKTIYTSAASMPTVSGAITYYAVFCKGGANGSISITSNDLKSGLGSSYGSGSFTKTISGSNYTFNTYACVQGSTFQMRAADAYIQIPTLPGPITGISSTECHNAGTGNYNGTLRFKSAQAAGNTEDYDLSTKAINATSFSWDISGSYTSGYITTSAGFRLVNLTISYGTPGSKYLTNCCTDPGLNYGTGSVTKTFGDAVFTNTLTNSHGVAVTYSSSDETVATVNGSGQVTILKAGSTTITASSIAQTVAAVSYCADEASYTLTVNKASISPTLTYDPAAVTVGSTLTSFTLSGNSGSGSVSYSSSNDAIATVNSSGVVTGVAPGTVTITATIAATTNYNGNTATSNTITVNAAACTGVNSLHTGNKDQGGWVTNQCFEDADWGAADDAIYVGAFPLTNECYVGWAGGGSYYGTNWAVGGIKTYDIPTGRTLGWNSGNYYESYPGGALGTFHIYKNSTDENYYLRFKPSSYILRTGSDGTSWTSREMTVSATNSHYYETAELDLTSTLISEHAYVDLKTNGGDGHVWCNFSNDRTASGNVKVKSSVGDADGNFRGDNLKASDNGTHGKFRIDITKDVDNWKLAFVPMYRITYAPGTGASGSMDPSSYAEISTTIAAAAEGFTDPTGKQFNGWSDGVNSYAAGANVTMNSNVTLTAQWTDIDYTVTVSQSPDVSATTTGQTSSAHYNGTINLTVTDIPSGYRFVNWTTSDGFSITNPTSATTASFTMPNKNVTVTANFQQTHKVDWYVGGSAPANKIGDDGQTTVVDHGGKISDFPAHDPDGSACDKEFVGWTNTSSYVHGTSPLFNDVAGSPTINANASFYAVYATESGGSSTVFSEDFSTCSGTGGNSGGWSGSIASASVPSGISTSWYLSKANAADECLKLGTGSAGGSAETPDIDCGTATSATLTFRAGAWDGSSEGTTLSLSASNCSIDKSSVTLVKGSFTSYTVAITSITDDIAITFYTSSGNQRFFLDDVVVTASTLTYTGHTITCSDCGTSVTPTYTASPTGGTVSVTKSATPVTSGSTVKTCTSVDLTVTITPASHYTLTGFTATGLTTGTATISPAVNTVVPTTSAQTFTVTVSSGATGTLTLTPTFTPETPLTITLNTNNKGTFTPIGDVYSGESFTFPVVTPSDAECASFLGWIEGTTFDGDGETTDPSDVTSLPEYHAASTSSGTLTTNKTYTAVFGEKDTQETTAYVKVAAAPADWSGDYLIVRESIERAFNGSLETLDAANNYIDITIVDGKIAKGSLAANQFTIAKVGATDNYTIKSASGKYIGRTATSNGLDASTSTEYTNTLAYSSDHVVITSSGGPTLQMNGDTRFRYYASSQQELQLYKLGTAQMITYTYKTNPACTPRYRVTVNSAVGGSPSADKTYEHADEAITLTAHPAAGYSFTGWTITHTEGGAAASVTYTTGSASTETAVFEMPAYDVTVTATYAKIPVASLQVKDGETVIANSGTVNISTGANKTLTVVVTPADAFDHSWSASVTGGGTYASITNVQAGTFQVNGLAQGDATVTVTAPNDGDAKTVTFTVHVTDILPTEVVLKRDGSNTSISELSIYEGQYVKVNVSFTPTPTNKDFSVSADGTFVTIHAQAHTNPNYYATLNGKKVTTSPVNVTFTSAATSSVTKNLVVTVLPLLTDTFVDYIHGQATQTVSARLSVDKFTLYTDINTPSLSDASDAEPTSADCETSHYHLIGWLPKATAEALWAAGTAITESTEGLVKAGVQVEAIGQTWYAIWGKEQ